MENNRLNKQQNFLWIVQTVVLANGINLASDSSTAEQYRHCFSATGVFGFADEAIRASELIPDQMNATEAAHEFCTYMLANWRVQREEAQHSKLEVPYWFARS